jgi:hypothetical protein
MPVPAFMTKVIFTLFPFVTIFLTLQKVYLMISGVLC